MDVIDIKVDGNEEEIKITKVVDITQYLSFIHKEKEVLDATNGFSKKKTMRKLASVPIDALLALGEEGVALMNETNPKAIYDFFKKHPEFLVVKKP